MNKLAILSVSAAVGTALFAVSFLGFAKLNGVPMHTLPVLGGMFSAPPAEPHAAPSPARKNRSRPMSKSEGTTKADRPMTISASA